MAQKLDLAANVLKVGHHGYKDATSLEFLNNVNPEYAVISTNKNNKLGYPSREILHRLENHNIKTFITYESGTVGFKTDGVSLQLITE